LDLLPDDVALISLYARRGATALTEDDDLWGEFPTRSHLQDRLDRLAGTPAVAPLRALMEALDRSDPDKD
jgi:hypothetical protein